MIAFWTVVHGIISIALVGAITHQGLAVWRKPGRAEIFIDRFRAVSAVRFTNTIVILYVLTFALGAYIYPPFVVHVKGALADDGLHNAVGVFQLKEHIAVIALGLLPVYWHFWRTVPLDTGLTSRRFLTTFLLFSVWWNLVVGHVVNNFRGMI